MKRILSADNGIINHIEKLYNYSVINVEVFISRRRVHRGFQDVSSNEESPSRAGFDVEGEKMPEIREINETLVFNLRKYY